MYRVVCYCLSLFLATEGSPKQMFGAVSLVIVGLSAPIYILVKLPYQEQRINVLVCGLYLGSCSSFIAGLIVVSNETDEDKAGETVLSLYPLFVAVGAVLTIIRGGLRAQEDDGNEGTPAGSWERLSTTDMKARTVGDTVEIVVESEQGLRDLYVTLHSTHSKLEALHSLTLSAGGNFYAIAVPTTTLEIDSGEGSETPSKGCCGSKKSKKDSSPAIDSANSTVIRKAQELAGLVLLAECLDGPRTKDLTSLTITQFHLERSDIPKLAAVILKIPGLVSLSLWRNSIGADTAIEVAESLQHHNALELLNLGGNSLHEDTQIQLERILQVAKPGLQLGF